MPENPPSPWKFGLKAQVERAFSADDVARFAALSGDHNPLHLDEAVAAADPRFGQRIVHGMLVASLISGLLGEQMPGPGTIYLGQQLSFRAPVFLDEVVTATVELIAVREDKPIGTVKTTISKADGTVCVTGEAVVVLP